MVASTSLFPRPACVYWFCAGITSRQVEGLPWNLWLIQGETVQTKRCRCSRWWFMIDGWDLQTLTESHLDYYSKLHTWNSTKKVLGTITMETHAKKGELDFMKKKKKIKRLKKKTFFSSFTLILEEKWELGGRINIFGQLWTLVIKNLHDGALQVWVNGTSWFVTFGEMGIELKVHQNMLPPDLQYPHYL